MQITPLHPLFAAELTGADLSAVPSATLVRLVEQAMDRYGVLVVRGARISDAQHKAFARAFGPLEVPSRARKAPMFPDARRQFDAELFYAGNLDADGEIVPYASDKLALAKGAELFHTDSSFHAMPTKWSLLLGHEVPPPEAGGDTLFADTRAAWADLPPDLQARIAGLTGLHDFWEGRRRAGLKGEVTPQMRQMIPFPTVEHPLVRTMADGRPALFVGGHCIGIKGMGEAEGQALIRQLYDHATQDRYVYRHQWAPHDLVIWDNRCTMHAATPLHSDAWRRDMRRATINEQGPEMTAFAWMGIDAG